MNTFYPSDELPGTPRVLLASRLLWDKGIGEFVDAARLLKKRDVDVKFVLTGGFDHANPASISEGQLKQWENEEIIEWWGECTQMPAVMQKVHIVCLPSYREGLPRVLVEAAASARAIVTTDVPGCCDVVRHEENGLLVPVKNSEALALAIESLVNDPARRREMGRRGRERVEQEFDLNHIIHQTLDVYKELIKGTSRKANVYYFSSFND